MTEPMKTAEFAKLKYQVGEILCRKFLEYNDGKFHTAIDLNPATHALTEFVEQQVAAERERIKKDKNHLQWLYARLVSKHGENEHYDYMIKFKEIIDSL